jgi:nitroreductase
MELPVDRDKKTDLSVPVLDAIYLRRAVRSYSPKKVEARIVNKLIDAAIQAPSAMNSQPWAFVVIQNPQMLHDLSESAKVFLAKNDHWSSQSEHFSQLLSDSKFDIFYGATTLIVICAKEDGFGPREDCYLAGENLMLAATAFGIGSCPIGFARDVLGTKEFREKFSIAEGYVPVLPIIIGYPSTLPSKPERKDPLILKWAN